jgi:hypothetical protein
MENDLDLVPYLLILLRRRWFICINTIVGAAVGYLYAFYIVIPQYQSSITFLPPSQKNSMLSLMPASLIGGALSTNDIQPEQILSIFGSQSLRLRIIDKFNLFEKYKVKDKPSRHKVAFQRLEKDLTIQSNEIGTLGLSRMISYSIAAFHTSPDTAELMVRYGFALMDSAVSAISVELGRRDRCFLESQLAYHKHSLDSTQTAFRSFQLSRKAYDLPGQAKSSMKSYAQIKANYLMNDYRLQMLLMDHQPDHPDVQSLQNANTVLKSTLAKIESDSFPSVGISLSLAAELAPEFVNGYRDIKTQELIIIFLTQQLEQARIKEARTVSILSQIDPSIKPLYKARPKRIFVAAGITGLYLILICAIILLQHFYTTHIIHTRAYHEIIDALHS